MVNIAFVCHCDKKHGKNTFPKHEDVNVIYIDPGSGCKNWNDVENGSLDIMYTINCPVYYPYFDKRFNKDMFPKSYQEMIEEEKETMILLKKEWEEEGFKDGRHIMDSLFEDGFKKLKVGGKLFIPINTYKKTQSPSNFIKYVKDTYPGIEFESDITYNVPYEYMITWDSEFGRESGYTAPQNAKYNDEKTKFLVMKKINSRDQFYKDIEVIGKDEWLKHFLTSTQHSQRKILVKDMSPIINKIKKAYPSVTNKDVLSLFRKN